jgi:hypothetical protein
MYHRAGWSLLQCGYRPTQRPSSPQTVADVCREAARRAGPPRLPCPCEALLDGRPAGWLRSVFSGADKAYRGVRIDGQPSRDCHILLRCGLLDGADGVQTNAPSQQRNPGSETSVTVNTTPPAASETSMTVTTTPPAVDGPKPITIPPVLLPTPSSQVNNPDYCGIPGVPCAPPPPVSRPPTTPDTSTPDTNEPSGGDLSPTTAP